MHILIALFLAHTPCRAQWTRADIFAVKDQTKHSLKIDHPYWDQVRAYLLSGLQTEVDQVFGDTPVGQTIKISSTQFSKSLPVIYCHRGTIAKPLVVYLPTLMQDDDGPETVVHVKMLLEAGNDVLYIPNPLSPSYLSAEPIVRPLHLIDEANVIAASLMRLRRLGHTFTKVNLFGVSYGAFLAAIVAARYPELIDGQTTLIYPPLDLAKAMRQLDEVFPAADAPWWHPIDRLVGSDLRDGFQSALHAMQLNPNFADSDLPGEVQFRSIKEERQNFSKIAEMLGSGEFLKSEQAQLFYWLEMAYKGGNPRLRVLESSNDFLNEMKDWQRAPEWLPTPEHLLIHHNGGHDGFYDSAFYRRFVVKAMN